MFNHPVCLNEAGGLRLSRDFWRLSECPCSLRWATGTCRSSDAASLTGRLGFSHCKDQPVIESKDPADFLFSQVFTLNQADFYIKP